MTGDVRFVLVDVFATSALEGNPLAVVPDADHLDEPTMRALAREFNQSETTFIVAPTMPGAARRLRSFTPTGDEVFGAGHNALGAWWWLAVRGHVDPASTELRQQIGDRSLPVRLNRGPDGLRSVALTQDAPHFGAEITDPAGLGHALGLTTAVLHAQVVSTGAGHLLVEVADRDAVDDASPDAPRLRSLLADAGGQGCYLWAADPIDDAHHAYARFFNPTVGIVEDPATGSAAGPLAALLARRRPTNGRRSVLIEQGHATGRPSVLEICIDDDHVELVGTCVVVAEGTITALPPRGRSRAR